MEYCGMPAESRWIEIVCETQTSVWSLRTHLFSWVYRSISPRLSDPNSTLSSSEVLWERDVFER